jgi:outer membrane protein
MRMMKILRTIIPAVLLMTFLSGSALAQTKIATVDLKKLFDGYYRTKLASASWEESRTQMAKDEKDMTDDLTKGGEDYKKLLAQANDQALSASERDRNSQAAADKLKKLQVNKSAIDQYDRQAQTTLAEKRQRMTENIVGEIKTAVAAKAKAAGYSLVLDSTGATIAGTPMVVYTSGDNDLTEAVLAQLNAGAPIDLTRPAATSPPMMPTTGNP